MINLRTWLSQGWVGDGDAILLSGRETTKAELLRKPTAEMACGVVSAECFTRKLETVYRLELGPAIDCGAELARINAGIAETEACLAKATGKPGNWRCVSDLRKKLGRQTRARAEWLRSHPGEAR